MGLFELLIVSVSHTLDLPLRLDEQTVLLSKAKYIGRMENITKNGTCVNFGNSIDKIHCQLGSASEIAI